MRNRLQHRCDHGAGLASTAAAAAATTAATTTTTTATTTRITGTRIQQDATSDL